MTTRYQRFRRRDWRYPFNWFVWYQWATSLSALTSVLLLSEDGVGLLSEDGVSLLSE